MSEHEEAVTDIEFETRNREMIAAMARDPELQNLTQAWFERGYGYEYSYHFTWMGLPIIQYPQDIVAMQELIWTVRPNAIIETGIARGGSIVFYASMLEVMAIEGIVVGVDIDIRRPNRMAVEGHPMSHRIRMIEGSSTDSAVVDDVKGLIAGRDNVMVVLDSNHTHRHVLEELRLYGPLVSPGSYLVVFDTVVELMPPDTYPDRPWGRGDNPMSAVKEFLADNPDFEIDETITDKLLVTVAPSGYLRRRS